MLTAVTVALAAVAMAVVLVVRQHSELASVADLDRGDCVDGRPFLEGQQPSLSDLSRADCDDAHDAEVLGILELDEAQAAAYRPVVPDEVCLDQLGQASGAAVDGARLLVAGVADVAHPEAGDDLACFGFAADGTRLDRRLLIR